MRWPWSRKRGGRHRGTPRAEEPTTEDRTADREEIRARLLDADRRLKDTMADWSDVSQRSMRLARLSRENHISGLIDQALRSGPA
jgi:hypothetical protein